MCIIQLKKSNNERGVVIVVTTDNKLYLLYYNAPDYDILNNATDGVCEHVYARALKQPYCMLVNDDGYRLDLPLNQLGTELYGTGYSILGNIIIAKIGCYEGEPDVVGMTEDEAREMGDEIVEMSDGAICWAENGKKPQTQPMCNDSEYIPQKEE